MRIGISALFQASGGSLIHLRQLLRDWAEQGVFEKHEVVVFAGRATRARLEEPPGEHALARVRWRILGLSDRGWLPRVLAEKVLLPRALRQERVDCLFCPANIVPRAAGVPCVVLLQNAAPFCSSVSFRSVGLVYWMRFRLMGALMRGSARRADHVLFISRYFLDLFVRRYAFPPGRGTVLHRARAASPPDGSGDRQLEKRIGVRRPYALVVSHLNPYKNLVEVIEGFARARREGAASGLQLVLVGRRNHAGYYRKLVAATRRNGLGPEAVLLAGELGHSEVQTLMADCSFYVFSSTCENCPTALIEALDRGLPVACSNVGVMPEIGGEAVRYFDPNDVEDISRMFTEMAADGDLRERLRKAARKQAARFPDGAEVARKTIGLLEAVANRTRVVGGPPVS